MRSGDCQGSACALLPHACYKHGPLLVRIEFVHSTAEYTETSLGNEDGHVMALRWPGAPTLGLGSEDRKTVGERPRWLQLLIGTSSRPSAARLR